jgi:hypothetical protein
MSRSLKGQWLQVLVGQAFYSFWPAGMAGFVWTHCMQHEERCHVGDCMTLEVVIIMEIA